MLKCSCPAAADTKTGWGEVMAGASATLHEDPAKLSAETVDKHRAYVSLQEELEAIDWYNQRVDATEDEALKAILVHNRDDEKEHAAMVLEWIRRHDPELDAELRKWLFTEGPITATEQAGQAKGGAAASGGALKIGSLRDHDAGGFGGKRNAP
jgi:uncharacterized protein